jgi:hypothetical protein
LAIPGTKPGTYIIAINISSGSSAFMQLGSGTISIFSFVEQDAIPAKQQTRGAFKQTA